MKLTSKILSALICTAFLCGCSGNSVQQEAVSESETVTLAETTTADTEETTKITTSEETTPAETEAPEEEAVSETLFDLSIDLDSVMKDYAANAVEFGNEASGYISMYPDWTYEENDYGEYTLTSPDGNSYISTLIFTDISTDLSQSAAMFCLTVASNAEIDGYDSSTTNEVVTDGMTGYFTIMIDSDTDLGFRLYAAYPDEENGMIRAVKAECPELTTENVMLLSAAFDSYHR